MWPDEELEASYRQELASLEELSVNVELPPSTASNA
jgi:hypothetical protein